MIQREIYQEVIASIEKPEAIVLIGSRQVGKTTCLDYLENFLIVTNSVPQANILRFNLDIERDFENFESQAKFIELLKFYLKEDQRLYVFVDEIQRIKNSGKFFKGIYDLKLNLKLILTGSSSLEIRSSISESMAGRKKLIHFYPFSFKEFISIKDQSLLKIYDPVIGTIPSTIKEQILTLYREYLIFGAYPKVVLTSGFQAKFDELEEIYQSYIDKDIINLLNIGDVKAFKNLLRLLAARIGSNINNSELANDLNISVATVQKYLDILEETFVIFSVSPYFKNPNTEIKKSKKYYFHDTGLRNYILHDMTFSGTRTDEGFLLENSVATMLKQKQRPNQVLNYWRTKSGAEMDFVLESDSLNAYEVKTSYKLSRSMRSFVDNYKPDNLFLVNLEESKEYHYDDLKFRAIFPWQIT